MKLGYKTDFVNSYIKYYNKNKFRCFKLSVFQIDYNHRMIKSSNFTLYKSRYSELPDSIVDNERKIAEAF